jgi:hypothetical protein
VRERFGATDQPAALQRLDVPTRSEAEAQLRALGADPRLDIPPVDPAWLPAPSPVWQQGGPDNGPDGTGASSTATGGSSWGQLVPRRAAACRGERRGPACAQRGLAAPADSGSEGGAVSIYEAVHDHFISVPGMRHVPTRATQLNEMNLRIAIDTARVMCVHGGVGLGKSVAVRNNLRFLAPEDAFYFDLGPQLTLCQARLKVAELLGLPDGTKDKDVDSFIREVLKGRQCVLVFDEVQNLHAQFIEYVRNLWDDTTNRLTVVLIGTDSRRRLGRLLATFSRIYPLQPFSPLLPDEVLTVMPQYHPEWAKVGRADLLWVDQACCHGNFRRWATSTYALTRALAEEEKGGKPDPKFTRELFTRAIQGLVDRPPEALPVFGLPCQRPRSTPRWRPWDIPAGGRLDRPTHGQIISPPSVGVDQLKGFTPLPVVASVNLNESP